VPSVASAGATALTGTARLAQSAERKALHLVVVGSSPTVGDFQYGARLRGQQMEDCGVGGLHKSESVESKKKRCAQTMSKPCRERTFDIILTSFGRLFPPKKKPQY
jgi:hypothetical protein